MDRFTMLVGRVVLTARWVGRWARYLVAWYVLVAMCFSAAAMLVTLNLPGLVLAVFFADVAYGRVVAIEQDFWANSWFAPKLPGLGRFRNWWLGRQSWAQGRPAGRAA